MKDKVYIIHSELLVDSNDAYTEIVGGVFYTDVEKAREKMMTVFNNTTKALKDEHDFTDCRETRYKDSGWQGVYKMVFSADSRVSLVMQIMQLDEGK